MSATIAAASQNCRPRSSAANGTIQTTYWIENTLLVMSRTSSDANARLMSVSGRAPSAGRPVPVVSSASARTRRQASHASRPKPTTVNTGRSPSIVRANVPSTCTALNPNDSRGASPDRSPASTTKPPPTDSICNPRPNWYPRNANASVPASPTNGRSPMTTVSPNVTASRVSRPRSNGASHGIASAGSSATG